MPSAASTTAAVSGIPRSARVLQARRYAADREGQQALQEPVRRPATA